MEVKSFYGTNLISSKVVNVSNSKKHNSLVNFSDLPIDSKDFKINMQISNVDPGLYEALDK